MRVPTSLLRRGLVALALVSVPALAQQQDSFIRQLTVTRDFNLGRPTSVRITPDERTVLFLRSRPDANVLTLFAYDVASGQTRELLTPEALLHGAEETLSAEERARRERMRLSARGFASYALSPDGGRLLLPLGGKLYVVERAGGKVTALAAGPGAIDPRFSADGRQVFYVRDDDVYRVELASNRERRITRGGTPERTHGLPEFVAMEEMYRFQGFWPSPDGRQVAYADVDNREVEKLNLSDPAHPERPPNVFAYPRAGKANAKVKLFVAPLTGGPAREVRWDAGRYPYLATVRWPAKGPLTLLVQNRRQTEEVLLAADPRTGATRPLLTERDEAWLNLDQTFPSWLEGGRGFLWMTERNGAPEVELRRADGSLARSLVPPSAGFRSLVAYLEQEDTLYFSGGPNPTESYLWRVKAGGAPERVTSGGPAYESGLVSGKGGLLVLGSEGPQSLRRFHVLKADGTRLGELPSVAQEPAFVPRLEVRQVGAERFWSSLVRPRDFVPGRKLPVVVEVYGAGPPVVRQSMARYLRSQWLADHGFLVVGFDGRGTWLRGRDWERASKYDHGGITLDDQVRALKALAAEVPELDLTRVGITGWSNGGYMSALGVLKYPEVFKAAVAGAPETDLRNYDTHLVERFMGLPEEHPEAYEKASLLTYARQQRPIGKLLLVHGTADDNVFFSHTLALTDALFRAGKPYELLTLSGSTHMLVDPELAERFWERTAQYFRDNL